MKTVTIEKVKNPEDFYHFMCSMDGVVVSSVVVVSVKNVKKTEKVIGFDLIYGMGFALNILDKNVKTLKFKNDGEVVDNMAVVIDDIIRRFVKKYGIELTDDYDVIMDFVLDKIGY